jgi:PIN domain nuclease of toxin-antitoxin system
VTRLLLDTHVVHWWSAEPQRVSATAHKALDRAEELSSSFPGDPADRLIYATAIEHGLELVTKDRAIRDHDHPRSIVVW